MVISPKPAKRHQRALVALAVELHGQLPDEWEVVPQFEVVVRAEDPATVRVPDLVVVRVDCPSARAMAADVLIAVEIISPESRNVDTRLKPFEYADAGIPHYWLVDLDPPVPTITVFGLGAPRATATWRARPPPASWWSTSPSRCGSAWPR